MKILIVYFSRILSMILSIYITKQFIENLSLVEFGALSLWLSLTPWIGLVNFGLPVILQNRISLFRSENKDVNQIVQHSHDLSVFVLIILIALSLLVFIFFNAFDNFLMLAVILSLVINSLIQLYSSILYGFLLNDYPNHVPFLTNLILLFSFLALKKFISVQHAVGLSYLISTLAIGFFLLFRVVRIQKFRFTINFSFFRIYSNDMFSMSKIVILSNVVTALDFYFISRFDSPTALFNYSFLNKIFLFAITFQSILIANYWTRFADYFYMLERKKFLHLLKMILGGSLGFVFIILVSFFLLQDYIYEFLASGKNIKIEINFVLLVFLIFLVKVFANVFASILQAMGKFDNMFNYVFVQAMVALGLQVMLGWLYGAYGVLFAIIVSYLITAVWYLPKKVIEYI